MVQTQTTRPTRLQARLGPQALSPSRWGLALVEAVIGYEWLVSALNKLLNPGFRPGLAHTLRIALKDNPNRWWSALVTQLILPQAPAWATVIEIGELLIALGYCAGVVLWLSGRFPHARWTRGVNGVVLVALLGGALLTANYYLMAGETVPGVHPALAFQEGLSVDGLVTLLALALVTVHLLALRAAICRVRCYDTGVTSSASPWGIDIRSSLDWLALMGRKEN